MNEQARAATAMTFAEPAYVPLVRGCEMHGIGRSTAFALVRDGLLDTFTIGRSRYVYLESLRTLPARLAEAKTEAPVEGAK